MTLCAVVTICCAFAVSAQAQSLPANFTQTNYVSGMTAPTAFTFSPDGRIFICQQGGQLRVVDSTGTLLATPAISLTVATGSERGLLGVALDPNFLTNQFIYLYYTATGSPSRNRVSRFTMSGNTINPATESLVIDLFSAAAGNHNGGDIGFGIDGKLYIATGDGGSTPTNSQDLTNIAGKILRINADGSIPSDNPFFGNMSGFREEIWCYGLRNPWRFEFHPKNNALFIADVGQNTWEEINIGIPGANYGWPSAEGNSANPAFTNPLFTYNHNGTGASITGGDIYAGVVFPPTYISRFFYGDFVDSYIRNLVLTADNQFVSDNAFGTSTTSPVDIQYYRDAIWYTSVNTGTLRRISYAGDGRTPLTGNWNGMGSDTIGIYFKDDGTYALRNTNSPGAADLFYGYGMGRAGWIPLTGDWDGNGTDTQGAYDPATGTFFLRNTHGPGLADITYQFGPAGSSLVPIAGDWNGDGIDTVGLYDPTTGFFFLRQVHAPGNADITFQFGAGDLGVTPVAGDWDGDGDDSIGFFNHRTATFFLRFTNTGGNADATISFGDPTASYAPLVGDWNGDVTDTIGVYDRLTATYFLKNSLTPGTADVTFIYGPSN